MKRDRVWHAGHMLFALARYFNWWQQKMITEFEIGGLREDLVVVTRAGYATVVEIKVSRADWLSDRNKGRWERPSEHISRFFYAVPWPVFEKGIPEHVPEHVGILVVYDGGAWDGYDTVTEHRPARRFRAAKLPDEKLRAFNEAFYYRFWRQQMDLLRVRLHERTDTRAAA